MSLAENILANEKVMDNLARIYVDTLNAYYGNGKRGNDNMAKKDMIYYLEQNCGVCQTPSSIASQLSKIWGKIQEAARKYGYRGPIVQPKPEGLSYYLQDIANKVLADEQIMNALGWSCYYASQQKNLVKGAMMSDKYWGSYPNELKDWVRDRHWGYLGFNEAKEIVKFIKKDIAKYAKIAQQKEQAKEGVVTESQLKTIVMETAKKVLGEMYGMRRPPQKGYLWINGHDFLEKALELEDVELARTVKTDETLMEIFDGEFKIVCEASYYPATRYTPEENNFEILDDSGLMELIENVADENIKSALYKVYENDVEGGDFEFNDPDDGYADYIHDKMMDDRGMMMNESQLKDLVMETAKKVLKEMDELSPKLLQNAADTAWDKGRYSQAENFESEAGARASSEFGGDDNIRRITAKNIACVSPDGSAWSISRDGSYYFRPKSGYNNESGHLTGMTKFPDYMKTDKHTARTIVKWWQKYNNADAEIPFMNDWHELVKW